MKVVWDLDSTLNNLNEVVFKKLGILNKLNSLKYYEICRSRSLTAQEKREVLASYKSAKIHKEVELDENIDKIFNIDGVSETIIHSLCHNKEVADVKMEKLANIPKEHINLVIGCNKGIIEGADVVVDDSLLVLKQYPNEAIKIVMNQPYNQLCNYRKLKISNLIRVNSVSEAINIIEGLAGEKLKSVG